MNHRTSDVPETIGTKCNRLGPATSKLFEDNWKSILGWLGVPSAAAIFAAIRVWMKKKRA
jgi:hypothetical protein